MTRAPQTAAAGALSPSVPWWSHALAFTLGMALAVGALHRLGPARGNESDQRAPTETSKTERS
jgi:hypothetical protein